MSIKTSNYRDDLVQTIKDLGQELIDRAETMVAENCELITNFEIHIDIPQPMEGAPGITWSTSTVSKSLWKRDDGLVTGKANIEIETNTVVVEPVWMETTYDEMRQETIYKCPKCGYCDIVPGTKRWARLDKLCPHCNK